MTDIRNFSKGFVIDFIEMYRGFPCLWRIKSSEYSDKYLRKAAYDALAGKLREVIPNANKPLVVKKIDSLRRSFRKEYKILKESQGTKLVYKPKLWYFDHLLFLQDQNIPRLLGDFDDDVNAVESAEKKGSSLPDEELLECESTTFIGEEKLSQSQHHKKGESSITSSNSPHSSGLVHPKRRNKRKLKAKEVLCSNILKQVSRILEAPVVSDDEFDIIGKNVSLKLRRLPKNMKIISEKLILDILFNAEMGYLHENTSLSLGNRTRTERFVRNIGNKSSKRAKNSQDSHTL